MRPVLSLLALADPTRRRIVELLAREEYTAGEIVKEFDLSAPAISQHLKLLRAASLLKVVAEGQRRVYSVNPAGLAELDAWLRRTLLHLQAQPAVRRTPRRAKAAVPAEPVAGPGPIREDSGWEIIKMENP